jgi:hypothetical protein
MTNTERETARSGEWTITTTDGETVRGYLPDWAQDDPSRSGVRPDRLHLALADIELETNLRGLILPVAFGQAPAEATPVLAVTIGCKPFGEDDEPRTPTARVQIVDDFWIDDLGPDDLADLGRQLRTLGDFLVTTAKSVLETARADWERHRPASRPHG